MLANLSELAVARWRLRRKLTAGAWLRLPVVWQCDAALDPCLFKPTMCHSDRTTVTMVAIMRRATKARRFALPFWINMCISDRTADTMKTKLAKR